MIARTFKTEYEYALIRYMPNAERGESANVGIVVKDGKRQCVLWNENFEPPSFLKSNAWQKHDMKKWQEFYNEELTVLSLSDADAALRLSGDYWNSIRARCKQGYILGESSFLLNNDQGEYEEEFSAIANRLFAQLVNKKKSRKALSLAHRVRSFFEQYHFSDDRCFRYPISQSYCLKSDSISIHLPFYQQNEISRAMWPLDTDPSTASLARDTVNRLGQLSVAKTCFQNRGAEAEYIFLTSKALPDDNANAQVIKAAQGQILPLDDEKTADYLREICAPIC
jgi:hypothetical protein